jgi:CelD/BcsL family acetyltransferase involved in cellulose biosynthesis
VASGAGGVRVVRPRDLSTAELETWQELQRQAPEFANPFLAPAFAQAVGLVNDTVRVAVLDHRGEPAGFLAYEQGRLGVGHPVGRDLSDQQGVVARRDLTWNPRALLAGADLQALHLVNVPRALLPAGAVQVRTYPSPVIDLRYGYDRYLAERRAASRSMVSNIQRKQRKLGREVGELRFVFDERSPEALRTVMRWKSAQYAELGEWDRFADPRNVALLNHLSDTKEPGCTGVLSVLYAGERIAAAHFGLRSRTVLCSWFPTYNVALSAYSPGILLHVLMAEAAAADGVETFDLGRGAHRYKDDIKSGDLELAKGWLFARSPAGWAHRASTTPRHHLRPLVGRHPALESAIVRAVNRYREAAPRR